MVRLSLAVLLSSALAVVDAKPLFDYTLGASPSVCKKFGPMLKQLYSAEGIAEAVDFSFHFAIRTAGDPTTDHNFRCPDEQIGCPYTKHAACAFKASSTQSVRAPFLICWEGSDESTSAQARTQTCASEAGLDSDTIASILSCANDSTGTELLVEAAQYFMQRFPEWSSVTGPYNVPHIFVNDEDQYGTIDYDSLLAKLCADGAMAAACSSLV